jgi:hypothetical protein
MKQVGEFAHCLAKDAVRCISKDVSARVVRNPLKLNLETGVVFLCATRDSMAGIRTVERWPDNKRYEMSSNPMIRQV